MKSERTHLSGPAISVHVAEPGVRSSKGSHRCEIGTHVAFSTSRLETYCLATWEPILYDALLVAGSAEFADRTQRRPAMRWARDIELIVPVHDPARWADPIVIEALHDALGFLTGDRWNVQFYGRKRPADAPAQGVFKIQDGVTAVIPFSDGLDSRCVAGLADLELRDRLVRVRLGSKVHDGEALSRKRKPFTSVPYKVSEGESRFVESSARSRGFKFALLSAIAAYLSKASDIIVSESGQGALGPALIPVGQGYEDYRSHPLFARRMEKLFKVLFRHDVQFSFPRLWNTKSETLQAFTQQCADGTSWAKTWSCWQQTRQVSVSHKKRQCGICAACMLRRMSIHAAGLADIQDNYVWENLSATSFEAGAAKDFPQSKITGKLRQYAIAGTLHLDHLAALKQSQTGNQTLDLHAFQLGRALGEPQADIRSKLDRLLSQHEKEWRNFVQSLGSTSFIADWAVKGRAL